MRKTMIVFASALALGSTSLSNSASAIGLGHLGVGLGLVHFGGGLGIGHFGGNLGIARLGGGFGGHFDGRPYFGDGRLGGAPYDGGYERGSGRFGDGRFEGPYYGGYPYGGEPYYGNYGYGGESYDANYLDNDGGDYADDGEHYFEDFTRARSSRRIRQPWREVALSAHRRRR